MSDHFRAYVALMALTLLAFALTRWIFAGVPQIARYDSRMKAWLLVTTIAFAIPNFWFALMGVGLVYLYLQRKDPNPAAVYLMFLLALPPQTELLPGFGSLSNIISLNHYRLLGLVLLLPTAISLMTRDRKKEARPGRLARITDVIAVLLFTYQLAAFIPYETLTMLMRRGTHMLLDLVLPYYVISRVCRDRSSITDAMMALSVAGIALGLVGLFEHVKGWLLYVSLDDFWGYPAVMSQYLRRGGSLRATASSGQALLLGHLLVVALGIFGFFRSQMSPLRFGIGVAILLAGLYATLSRGPWVAAAVILVLAGLVTTTVRRYYVALIGTVLVATAAALASPWSDRIIDLLPFIGTTDQRNVDYRVEILDTAIAMIKQNPLFGSVVVRAELENLRQGQGIIDIVNVYALIAMTFGLIGLSLFLMFFLSALINVLRVTFSERDRDRWLYELGGNTSIALIGSMVALAGVSNYLSVPIVYTCLVALLVAVMRTHDLRPVKVPARHAPEAIAA